MSSTEHTPDVMAVAGPSSLADSDTLATAFEPQTQGQPQAAPKKPRKPREPKAPKQQQHQHQQQHQALAQSMSTSGSSGSIAATEVKPLHRPVMVCRRCRTKKIKCDLGFPSCGPCLKAHESCVGLDPATGREVSRSYVAELEDRVDQLKKELEALRSGQRQTSGGPGSLAGGTHMLEQASAVSGKRPLAAAVNWTPESERPAKRPARGAEAAYDGVNARPLGPQQVVLGPNGVETMPAKALRPSLRQLNSYASGLSPARLLCQAIQQSALAGLRRGDSHSGSTEKRSGAFRSRKAIGPRLDLSSAGVQGMKQEFDHDGSRGGGSGGGESNVAEPASAIRETLLDPKQDSSRSVTSSDGDKKPSLFDDAEAMQYAEAEETSDITVPPPEQLLEPLPPPAPFPPVPVARKLVDAYFERVNPQWPLLDRKSFMVRFEAACRDGLARARAKAQARAEGRQSGVDFDEERIEIELQPADGHLFHLILSIAAAIHAVGARFSAERHHEAAMRYLNPRRANNGGQGVGVIMGRDSLEQLSCLLLSALYSMMRTSRPGIWYTLGISLRLTTGLGLYTEKPGLSKGDVTAVDGASESLAEKKRRLFWCAYSIDRSVGVHLGRPFGIADADVNCAMPWQEGLDSGGGNAILREGGGDEGDEDEAQAEESASVTGFDERASDTSTERLRKEAASTLAALGESRASPPNMTGPGGAASGRGPLTSSKSPYRRPKEGSRWVSLAFFRMRVLQSEIRGLLFSRAELPRRFASFEHWKDDMLDRLAEWRAYAPSSKEELEGAGCGYNPIFLELNFRQTLLMIYGMSPRFPTPNRSDLAAVEDCSRVIIKIYAELAQGGQLNYEFMTGHNVFIACVSLLYANWQMCALYPATLHASLSHEHSTKVAEIEHYGKICDDVLASLKWYTAEKCRKCLRTMFAATSSVVEQIEKMLVANHGKESTAALHEGQSRAQHHQHQQHLQHIQPPPPPSQQQQLHAHRISQPARQQQQHCAGQQPGLDGPTDKWWDPARDSAPGWDAARTSDMRSEEHRPAMRTDGAGLSARSLYTQESAPRTSSSAKTPRGPHAMLPPVQSWSTGHAVGPNASRSGPMSAANAGATFSPPSCAPALDAFGPRSRSGSRSSMYYSAPTDGASAARSPHAAGSGPQQDGSKLWKAAGSPRFLPIDGASRHLTSQSSYVGGGSPTAGPYYGTMGAESEQLAYATSLYGSASMSAGYAQEQEQEQHQTGTTPSNSLEFEAIGDVHSSPGALLRQTLGASPGRPSVHSVSTNSPTYIDFSSLMADSAMELDQLFRDSGLSINLDASDGPGPAAWGATSIWQGNGGRGYQRSMAFADGGAAGSATAATGSGSAQFDLPAGLGNGGGGSGGGNGGGGCGPGMGQETAYEGMTTSGTSNLALFGNRVASSDDGLENDFDWEAMGFAFRMTNQSTATPDQLGGGAASFNVV